MNSLRSIASALTLALFVLSNDEARRWLCARAAASIDATTRRRLHG